MVMSAEVLIERATALAGSDDLGADGWQEGLAHLLDAADRDAGNDPAAVAKIEAVALERLVTRLRVEAWYAAHGHETEQPVRGPVFIIGLPRTATTALNYLLALEPQLRPLRSWELKDPVPPPVLATEHLDARRASQPLASNVRHIASVDGPAEDWPIHTLVFDHAELALPVPSNTQWWRERNHDALLPYHERMLRLLHSHRPPALWLLKSPAYLFLLPETARHYPEATFVFTHRDPAAAFASTCSTVADSRRQRTPSWSPGPTFGADLLEHWAVGMTKALAARKVIGEHRFVDVAQRELEADPVGTAERVLAHAGITLTGDTRQTMAEWSAANRRGSRGEHHYSLSDYGVSTGEVTEAFAPYLAVHGHQVH